MIYDAEKTDYQNSYTSERDDETFRMICVSDNPTLQDMMNYLRFGNPKRYREQVIDGNVPKKLKEASRNQCKLEGLL